MRQLQARVLILGAVDEDEDRDAAAQCQRPFVRDGHRIRRRSRQQQDKRVSRLNGRLLARMPARAIGRLGIDPGAVALRQQDAPHFLSALAVLRREREIDVDHQLLWVIARA